MPSSTSSSKTGWFITALLLPVSLVLFFLIGETYLRLSLFGPEAVIHFNDYLPAIIQHPACRVERDQHTLTGLKANSTGMLKGRPFQTNRFGFRDLDRPLRKTPGTVRILVCGASIGMGAGIGQEETYPRVLEHLLNGSGGSGRYEVINLSMANFNIDRMFHALKTYGLQFEPDILLLEGQDYYRWSVYVRNYPYPKVLGKGVWETAITDPASVSFFYQAIHNDFLPRMKKSDSLQGGGSFLTQEEIKNALRGIQELAGGRKVFMIDLFPISSSILYDATPDKDVVKRFAAAHGFEYIGIDLQRIGSGIKDRVLYAGDRHPNQKANLIIAQTVYEALEPILRSKPETDTT